MIIAIRKLFDDFYKKNKLLSQIIFFILLAFAFSCGKIFIKNASGYIKKLEETSSRSYRNEIFISKNYKDILSIEASIEDKETLHSTLVSRKSFNDYISRKDNEYHEQIKINNDLYAKIGFLDGKMRTDNE